MIVIAGTIIVSDETRAEVVACLAEMRKATLEHDAGVVAYRFAADLANPNLIHVYEEWESTALLKDHMQKPHMDAFRDLRNRLDIQTEGFSRWRAEELGQF